MDLNAKVFPTKKKSFEKTNNKDIRFEMERMWKWFPHSLVDANKGPIETATNHGPTKRKSRKQSQEDKVKKKGKNQEVPLENDKQ